MSDDLNAGGAGTGNLSSDELEELLEVAKSLAISAGAIVREGAGRQAQRIDTKSTATDVVTETDHASETHIVQRLRSERPADGIIGEEGTSVASNSGLEWHVDPLDGTVNFLYGIPAFAVSVGVVQNGVPVAGAVFNPVLEELYWARQGGGAFRNGARIVPNDVTDLPASLVATGFGYDSEQRAAQAVLAVGVLPRVRDIRRLGSAATDLCHVACGRVDAYYEAGVHTWDVAAATVIAREAGAVVTGISTDVPETDVLATCSRQVHEGLSQLVRPISRHYP